jgi:DNA polymerase I
VSCDDQGNCYPQGAHPRGVWNSNQILGLGLDSSSKPRRVYIKDHWFDEVRRNIDVLAFEEGRQLEPIAEEVTVDVPRMTTTLLVNPLEQVCDAVGVDVGAAVRGQEQTNLGAF